MPTVSKNNFIVYIVFFKLKSLRDRYTREIKKETLPSGSGLRGARARTEISIKEANATLILFSIEFNSPVRR
jgi:hypothetical protein